MKTFFASFRLLIALTVLTGVVYPLAVWGVGQLAWHDAAEGSLVVRDGRTIGSRLLAQKTTDPRYFWPRPSVGDYGTVASGASNQSWTNAKLHAAIAERRASFGNSAVDPQLLTASGSGLDPELSPDGIQQQSERVARARTLSPDQRHALDELIAGHVKGGQLSPARVNVLELNLALDRAFPPQ